MLDGSSEHSLPLRKSVKDSAQPYKFAGGARVPVPEPDEALT
jgi:hypothetical protein